MPPIWPLVVAAFELKATVKAGRHSALLLYTLAHTVPVMTADTLRLFPMALAAQRLFSV